MSIFESLVENEQNVLGEEHNSIGDDYTFPKKKLVMSGFSKST